MGVSVKVLASGSRGNSTIVQSSSTRILVDAGISCRETFKRMKEAGDDPHSLSAILITHEHADHVNGLLVLARKLRVPVFMTEGTHHAWARALRDAAGSGRGWSGWNCFSPATASISGTSRLRPSLSRTMRLIP